MARVLVFDVETSGLPNTYQYSIDDCQEIIQFSYWYVVDGRVVDYGDTYFKSRGSYSPDAICVHGLSKRKVDALATVYFEGFIPRLKELVYICTDIVGHNISFDIRQIYGYCNTELNKLIESKNIVCTMRDYPEFSYKLISGKDGGTMASWVKLSELASKLINAGKLNLDDLEYDFYMLTGKSSKSHDAMWDSYLTLRCYQCLEEMRIANKVQ